MRKTLASVQFLRFVAATLVVMDHAIAVVFPSDAPIQHYASTFGASGVHIFFVISGFIMVYTSFNGMTRQMLPHEFLIRRLVRIYPIYWLYALLFLTLGVVDHSVAQSLPSLVGSFLLLPGFAGLIIGPGWSLAYELYFYLCFSAFMMLPMPKGLIAMAGFFLASIVVRYSLGFKGAALDVVAGSIILDFIFGASIGLMVVSGRVLNGKIANVMICLGVACFAVGVLGYSGSLSSPAWGIPSALLLAGMVFRELAGRLSNTTRTLSFLGDSSYSLYLLHVLLIGIMVNIYSPSTAIQASVVCIALVASCVATAMAAYQFVERPLVKALQDAVKRPDGGVRCSR